MPEDLSRLKRLWGAASIGAALAGIGVAAFCVSADGLQTGWLFAILLGLGLGFYARNMLIALLVWFFAPGLRRYFGETSVDREGDGVTVETDWRPSGDAAFDAYLASYAQAFEQVAKSGVWVLVIVTVIGIVYIASLFGLVDFSW